jgi:hypothetical protein
MVLSDKVIIESEIEKTEKIEENWNYLKSKQEPLAWKVIELLIDCIFLL